MNDKSVKKDAFKLLSSFRFDIVNKLFFLDKNTQVFKPSEEGGRKFREPFQAAWKG